jgi:hypothetical protein
MVPWLMFMRAGVGVDMQDDAEEAFPLPGPAPAPVE